MSAITDENRKRRSDPGNPKICNVFSLHQFFTPQEKIEEIDSGCRTAAIGCVGCKKLLIEGIWKTLEPIQNKRKEIDDNKDKYQEIIYENGKKCKKIAEQTMSEVREKMCLV